MDARPRPFDLAWVVLDAARAQAAWNSTPTRTFETVRALIRHIEQYIAHWNDHPTPFVWTKTPADIIAKAVRHGR